ncbi:MAG TPA: hypothetical protein VFF13_04185 [archaeon]|nr:hypothetical protein [archaeon]
MEKISRNELLKAAKSINDKIFGRTRKKKVPLNEALKEQINLSAKFALEKTLKYTDVSDMQKRMFVEIIDEQPDAINLLFAGEKSKQQAVEMLTPLFGEKTSELLDYFKETFNALQTEIHLDKKAFVAG